MTEPTFWRPDANRPLYYLKDFVLTDLPGYKVAFLPTINKVLDNQLTLSSTWTIYTGIYLFLGKSVNDEQELVNSIKAYIADKPVRFMWITNPQDPPNTWHTSWLLLNSNNTLKDPASITFNNYFLKMNSGTPVILNSTASGFELKQENGLFFQRDSYVFPISGYVQIPFAGEHTGCLEFSLPLQDSTTAGAVPAFAQLDACICYFVPDAAVGPDAFAPVRYPVLNLQRGPITLYARLDPVHALVPKRTALRFLESTQSNPPTLSAAFTTVYGSMVTLIPRIGATDPQLIFNLLPSSTRASASAPFYLAFDGPFTLTIPSSAGSSIVARLMTGFTGIEYLGFGIAKCTLTFVPNQPAYAVGLQQSTPGASDTLPLGNQATTSWISLTPEQGGTISYFAQPEEAVFYASSSASSTDSWLPYLEIFAGTFPSSQSAPFPMVPYALLKSTSLVQARQLEEQILTPYRRDLMAQFLLATEQGPTTGKVLSATAQGWLLQLDQNLRYWQYLTLASHQNGNQLWQVKNVKGGFKNALQSTHLFAVISNKDEFLRCCEVESSALKLTIDGWGFDLSPQNWGEHNTLMLIKYAGQSIEELAANLDTWNWLEAADGWNDQSGDIRATQAELLAIIQKARDQSDGELAEFYVNVLKNPDWNGVLFLRTPLFAFPANLQSLVVGINEDALYAHHIGTNSTPVLLTQGQIVPQDSAFFGLIDYADTEDLYFNNLDYAYKVLALKVSFQNSVTASFNSQIELMINKLFSDFAMLEDSVHNNNLVLNGFLQGEGDEAVFVFLDEGTHVFRLANSVLNRVEVTRVQFLTLPERQDMPGTVFTVFVLAGSLEFEELAQFDLFSFGSSPTSSDSGSRLPFSNMLIHMDFPEDQPSNLDFRFDVESLAFNQASSVARPGSLYQHFPLKVAGLLQGLENSTPGESGYISVKSPLVQSRMDYPWYGLAFELDLGTLGALAGDIGLTVTLLAAWQPAEGARRTYVGIKLPGSTSARPEIPIEGVLKLNFSGIEFTVGQEQSNSYILHFKNMALRLLSFSFPPGQTDISLFGDPSGGNSGTLGWYAAYTKDEKQASLQPARLRQRLIAAKEAEHD